MTDDTKTGADGRPWPGLGEAAAVWARIALLSFGGPAGQIAVMHRILVEEKRWLGDGRFFHALNFCMLLPGPEAQQLATYVGWLMHRTWGGLIAGIFFILPGVAAILILSWIYVIFGEVAAISGLFFGLKAAVLAIVLQAVIRIGKRSLAGVPTAAVAIVSFIAIFVFAAPFPAIVLGAAMIGFAAARAGSTAFAGGGHGSGTLSVRDADTILGDDPPARDGRRGLWGVSVVCLVLWLGPLAGLAIWLGPGHVFTDIAIFFSKMATVTFGGAYAVLAYVAQAGVETYGWLEPGEMLDGLGMAETTPGPLIMVTQFVGFLGAYRDPGSMDALTAGTLGGLLTTWVTFAPCFLWIFLGAPFVEQLRENRALASALAAITAAVVGVVLNLAVWFALHVLFRQVDTVTGFGMHVAVPQIGTVDPTAAVLASAALAAVFAFKAGPVFVLAGAAAAGMAARLAGVA